MNRWFRVPDGLDLVQAAALPMTVDTAFWHLSALGFDPEKTILIHGAGTTIGFAAVQIALLRGMRVIATAGETYAQRLRDLGARVTAYGDGMVERVTEINGGPVDLVLNTAPVGGCLPDLVRIAGADPKRVLTISDFAAAAELGVRDTFHEDRSNPVEALPEFGQLAADGRFTVPIAATFPLEEWKAALEISQTGHARGKLLLLPGAAGPEIR
jgi:NADPH:quinone reductase-like Zn-dependent oxidoreductase